MAIDFSTFKDTYGFQDAVLKTTFKYLKDRLQGNIVMYPIGMEQTDKALGGGLYNDMNLVIGARPGVGKSTFANQVMMNVLNTTIKPVCILYFNFEMSNYRQGIRLLSLIKSITKQEILDSITDISVLKELYQTISALFEGTKIYFIDKPLTYTEIRDVCHNVHAVHPDHLLLTITDQTRLLRRPTNMFERDMIENYMLMMAQLKKEVQSCNLILSQLNRNGEIEGRKGYTFPVVSDLFGSDGVGQLADVVFLLHRPELYIDNLQFKGVNIPTKGLVLNTIAKNRDGIVDTYIYKTEYEYGRFTEVDIKNSLIRINKTNRDNIDNQDDSYGDDF